MASQNKIIEMIGSVRTIYPYYAKDISGQQIETLVKTWTVLLKEYPDDIVEVAFFKCLQVCKMPPTPADVVEQIRSMVESLEPTDEEMWVTYEKALRDTNRQMQRFGESFIDETGLSSGERARRKVDEIWEGLPDKIKSYLGSKGELMRNAREWNYNAEYCTWEKPRFLKAMPTLKKRQEYSDMLLGEGEKRLLLK